MQAFEARSASTASVPLATLERQLPDTLTAIMSRWTFRFRPGNPKPAPVGIHELARGDKDTVARASQIIRGFVRTYVRDPDLLEDLVQSTLVELLAKLARGDRPQATDYWILAAASNAVRREQTQLRRSPQELRSWLHVKRASGLSTQYRARDQVRRVRELLAVKPERQRRALMAVIEGHDNHRVAEEFGMSPAALRTAVSRLRQELRDQLRREAQRERLVGDARAVNHGRALSGRSSGCR
jgi:RNA polymerase sigma factor (sigma-70 family)